IPQSSPRFRCSAGYAHITSRHVAALPSSIRVSSPRKAVVYRWIFTLVTSLSCVACAHKPVAGPPPTVDLADETSLAPGDVFEIRVYGEDGMTAKYQVAPDGTIRFPFLGVVHVAGKEASTVAHEIAEGLKNGGYLKEPHVSIFLDASSSKRVSVLGAVAKPGILPIVPGMTVVQAVSQAGGFTPLANKDETVVTRRVDDKLVR